MLPFGKQIVKLRIPILIVSILLLIPSAIGYFNTRVNYDILYYLPDDIETMQGQDILLNDFGKGAYAMFVAKGFSDPDAARLKSQIEQVDHVAEVIWYDTIADDFIIVSYTTLSVTFSACNFKYISPVSGDFIA